MDRLIWIAWRAFWVSVGACAVLIAQSLATPPAGAGPTQPPARELPPPPPPAQAAPVSAAVGLPTGAGRSTLRPATALPSTHLVTCRGVDRVGRSC